MAGWDDPAGRIRQLEGEVAALREAARIGAELDNHHNAAVCPYCRSADDLGAEPA